MTTTTISTGVRERAEILNILKYTDKPGFLAGVYRMCEKLERPLVVIDSWDAVVAQTGQKENRELLENSICDFASKTGTRFILVTEYTQQQPLHYFVDGVVTLKEEEFEGRCLRTMVINKLRGVKREHRVYLFTLNDACFHSFTPFEAKYPTVHEKFVFISDEDKDAYFSSRCKDLDDMLGGGYPRGSYVFIEIGRTVQNDAYNTLIMQTVANFVYQEKSVCISPLAGVSPKEIKLNAFLYGFGNELNRLTRVLVKANKQPITDEEHIVTLEIKRSEDAERLMEEITKLRKKTNQPVLHFMGYNTLETWYGKERLPELISNEAKDAADNSELAIAIGKYSTSDMNKHLGDASTIHLKIEEIYGSMVLYALKPRKELYNLEIDVSRGYPAIKLTLIV
jgi:hypothetical protein